MEKLKEFSGFTVHFIYQVLLLGISIFIVLYMFGLPDMTISEWSLVLQFVVYFIAVALCGMALYEVTSKFNLERRRGLVKGLLTHVVVFVGGAIVIMSFNELELFSLNKIINDWPFWPSVGYHSIILFWGVTQYDPHP